MNSLRLSIALALVCTAKLAFADCEGPQLPDVKKSFERAQALEKAGKLDQALLNYRDAEGYICQPVNPYEDRAAQRAAPLGKSQGAAAEKRGELDFAQQFYDAGGQFAEADRV